jgi:acyl-CoA synthetase (NDP forming)
MRTLTEKEAERFLKKEGFKIVETDFVKKAEELDKIKFKFPIVMKVSSKKIVHKTKVNGIRLGIRSKNAAVKAFKELIKIRKAEGVLVQEQVKGKEFLLGLKKTKDFGHVIGFGIGGSKAEKLKDVDFRVCGVKGVSELSKDKSVKKLLDKLCVLAKKYPEIDSLDINPLILSKKGAIIVDAQVFFD